MSMGIKRILLKLVDDIPGTPYQPTLKTNRFNFWLFYIPGNGFASVLDNGIINGF
jgi:hypothetical protein